MLTFDERIYKTSRLTAEQREVLDVLLSAPGTLGDVTKIIGKSFDTVEKTLCTLLHLGLCTRSNSSRTYGVFRAA